MLNDETNRLDYDSESEDSKQYDKETAATQDQESNGQNTQDINSQYRYSRNSIPFNSVNNTGYQGQNSNQNMGYQNNGYQGSVFQNTGYQNTNSSSYQNFGQNSNQNGYQNGYQNNFQNNYQNQYNQRFNQTAGQDNAFGSKPQKDSKKKEKKNKSQNGSSFIKNKAVRLVASAALFGIIAGGIMFGVNYAGTKIFPNRNNSTYEIATVTPNIPTSNVQSEDDNLNTTMNVESVAQAALPAMVELDGVTTVSGGQSYGGYGGLFGGGSNQAQTSGTGIIVGKNDTELLILTNAHVITDVNNLTCVFVDGKSVSATVKGSKTDKDIAVVAVDLSDINTETLGKIAIAELSDSDDVVLGQQVVAIGNALGEGQSVTTGIVSALNRSITVDNVTFSGLFMTDAAINSGNSGGALLNAAGKVVAINFAKTNTSGVEGMAYSIPVSTVKDLIDSLMNRETRSKVSSDKQSYLGISAVDITSSMASSYGYPQGVLIRQVASGSAAEKAGLGAYDIIVSFDDQTITSMSGLQSTMQYYAAGETVTVEYYHLEGSEYVLKKVDVVLDKKN